MKDEVLKPQQVICWKLENEDRGRALENGRAQNDRDDVDNPSIPYSFAKSS